MRRRVILLGGSPALAYRLPLTQAALGNTLGLSTVHINRTLQELRATRLISLKGTVLTVHDLATLEQVGFFNADYLHLGDKSPSG